MSFDIIIQGGTLATHQMSQKVDIAIQDGKFAAIGGLSAKAVESAKQVISVEGAVILPGVIDTQVHFREPGLAAKEDLQSGSLAAVMGGVTAVFEMPNTDPPTTNAKAIADKLARAHGRMHCDFAFYAGGTDENAADLPALEQMDGVCGVKVFMGSSTGNLLVADDEGLARILQHITRRAAFHSEDEARLLARRELREKDKVASHMVWRDAETALLATQRLLKMARQAGKKIHVLHVTTAEEMALLAAHKDIASVEVTPQHLTLAAPDCYERLGTFAQMNPPIRDATHQAALWQGVQAGIVDVIGSDHAPHTKEEKAAPYPQSPSGMPGVQTLLPLMLNHVAEGRLALSRLVELTSYNAHKLFQFANKGEVKIGNDADLTFVDLQAEREISEAWLKSRCGWSPFMGEKICGWPIGTMIRGLRVMWEGELVEAGRGQAIKFRLNDAPN